MRYGRPTTDKKESTIKLRVNEDMRNWIEQKSASKGLSMSEFLRELILREIER